MLIHDPAAGSPAFQPTRSSRALQLWPVEFRRHAASMAVARFIAQPASHPPGRACLLYRISASTGLRHGDPSAGVDPTADGPPMTSCRRESGASVVDITPYYRAKPRDCGKHRKVRGTSAAPAGSQGSRVKRFGDAAANRPLAQQTATSSNDTCHQRQHHVDCCVRKAKNSER